MRHEVLAAGTIEVQGTAKRFWQHVPLFYALHLDPITSQSIVLQWRSMWPW